MLSYSLTRDRLKRMGFEECAPSNTMGWGMRISSDNGRLEIEVYKDGSVWVGADCDEYESHSVCLTNPPRSVDALKKFCHYFGIKLKDLSNPSPNNNKQTKVAK
jgi:hypothetical protein